MSQPTSTITLGHHPIFAVTENSAGKLGLAWLKGIEGAHANLQVMYGFGNVGERRFHYRHIQAITGYITALEASNWINLGDINAPNYNSNLKNVTINGVNYRAMKVTYPKYLKFGKGFLAKENSDLQDLFSQSFSQAPEIVFPIGSAGAEVLNLRDSHDNQTYLLPLKFVGLPSADGSTINYQACEAGEGIVLDACSVTKALYGETVYD